MKKLKAIVSSVLSHSLTRSSAVVLTGTMVGNVSAYLYHLFIGRILGPVQYGELTALLSLLYIINVPTTVLQTVLTKFFSILKARNAFGKAAYLFSKMTQKIILIQCAGFVVLLPFTGMIAGFLHITSPMYIVWLYIVFATTTASIINGSVLTGFQKFTQAALYPNIGGILRLVFGVIGSFFGVGWTLISNIASNIISYFSYFLSLGFLRRSKAQRFPLSELNVSSFSLPAFLATLGMTALYSQDVVLVKHFFSAYEAGVYGALSVLGRVIFFASFAVGMVVFPVISERKEQSREHGKVVLYSMLGVGFISLSILIIYLLFPQFVVHALYGRAYEGAIEYLSLFGLFITLFSLSYLLTNISLAANKTGVWMLTVGAAVAQTLLIWVLHGNLGTIVLINTGVAAVLFASLLIYYRHAQ